jgi:hypothetical protein
VSLVRTRALLAAWPAAALVAHACVVSLYGASRRQLAPFAIWLAAVVRVDRVGAFYGWLWD